MMEDYYESKFHGNRPLVGQLTNCSFFPIHSKYIFIIIKKEQKSGSQFSFT